VIEVAVKTNMGEFSRFFNESDHTLASAASATRAYLLEEGFAAVEVSSRSRMPPLEHETRQRVINLARQMVEKQHCIFRSDQQVFIAHPTGCDAFYIEEVARLGTWFHELVEESEATIQHAGLSGVALWPEGPCVRYRGIRRRAPAGLRERLLATEPIIAALLAGASHPRQEAPLG